MTSELFDNRYRFIKDLGEGGFGKVFLAREDYSDLIVAIKQLKDEDNERQEAIIYEMQMIAKFNHPNIVTYKHNFVQDGLLFIVMEYCEKGSLRKRIGSDEPLKHTTVMKWMQTLTETLHFVHQKGIVHHDIKPDNLLLTEEDTIKISDFGIANTRGGTLAYVCPEMLRSETKSELDPRVDIYALGVTLLELLTGTNPFFDKSRQEILIMHEKKSFGISHLPEWIQEIILKAIAKTPELRFQSMIEFNQAIKSRYVPVIFDKDVIKTGDLAERANKLLKQKKWRKAIALIEYAETRFNASVNLLQVKGKYHLLQKETLQAKACFDKALNLNPRLDIQKELGWINLELKNYPLAISLLSDHLHRNPSDYEAYTLLMKCFYETSRYEAAIDLAKTILETNNENPCFTNNYYISYVLHHKGQKIGPDRLLKPSKTKNHFLDYNTSVILEEVPTHALHNKPTLKSKLLFMDHRFGQFSQNTLFITVSDIEDTKYHELQNPIIKIGREGCACNDILLLGGTTISRRHCLIINCKNDVWLHDLSTTGIYLNNEPVTGKSPLIGNCTLRIGKNKLHITDDKSRLF